MEPPTTGDAVDADVVCQLSTPYFTANNLPVGIDIEPVRIGEENGKASEAGRPGNANAAAALPFCFTGLDAASDSVDAFDPELAAPAWPGLMLDQLPNSLQLAYHPIDSLAQFYFPDNLWDVNEEQLPILEDGSVPMSTENRLWIAQNPIVTHPQVIQASANMTIPREAWYQQFPTGHVLADASSTTSSKETEERGEIVVSPTTSAKLQSPISTAPTAASNQSHEHAYKAQNTTVPLEAPVSTTELVEFVPSPGSQQDKGKDMQTLQVGNSADLSLFGALSDPTALPTYWLSEGAPYVQQAAPTATNSSVAYPSTAFSSSNIAFVSAPGPFSTVDLVPSSNYTTLEASLVGFPPPRTPALAASLQKETRFDKPMLNIVPPQPWHGPPSNVAVVPSAGPLASQPQALNPLSTAPSISKIAPHRSSPLRKISPQDNGIAGRAAYVDTTTFLQMFDFGGTGKTLPNPGSFASTGEIFPQGYTFTTPPQRPALAQSNHPKPHVERQTPANKEVPTLDTRLGHPSQPFATSLSAAPLPMSAKATLDGAQSVSVCPHGQETRSDSIAVPSLLGDRRNSRLPQERSRQRKMAATAGPRPVTVEDEIPREKQQSPPERPKGSTNDATILPEMPPKPGHREPAVGEPFLASTPAGKIPFQAWIPPPAKYKFSGEVIPKYIPEAGPFPPPGHRFAGGSTPRAVAKPQSQKAKAGAQKAKAQPTGSGAGMRADGSQQENVSGKNLSSQMPNPFFRGGIPRSILNQPALDNSTEELNFVPFHNLPASVQHNQASREAGPPSKKAATNRSSKAESRAQSKTNQASAAFAASAASMPRLAPNKTQNQVPTNTVPFAAQGPHNSRAARAGRGQNAAPDTRQVGGSSPHNAMVVD